MYPNSVVEFRILIKQNGSEELQVRYTNASQGYTSKWQTVPKIYEYEQSAPVK